MKRSIKAFIYPEDDGYVVECPDVHAFTQGDTLDQALANLKEAIALALEGEDAAYRTPPSWSRSNWSRSLMPGRLRSLSGQDVVRILAQFGFESVGRRGSHVKLRRVTSAGTKQTLHIPLHAELRRGTLRAIVQQASAYVPDADLQPHFYAD